ncbi:DUF2158 domain-containing protein [Rhizobium sp. Pop5]|uniref:YodC family protein n=1 Tax=Rhizobium TaxID=379 RepID=UPI000283C33D|nr:MULTISPECIES: DUF2158 domain-containing protein [Rhizobium]EJZ22440.1 hypothetical protein RCCGEPOP_04731 [Rhizobium sp. Pop5]NEK36308.1 DUF2158 domain-containing protein [Rhizobium leguminosarum]UVD57254.1 DUF2158 domain-containing protein [Rhizobium sp. Pop5]
MAFKIGDIVVLKSGGPKMTVVSEEERGRVYCSWFAGAKAEKSQYPVEALEAPKEEPKK